MKWKFGTYCILLEEGFCWVDGVPIRMDELKLGLYIFEEEGTVRIRNSFVPALSYPEIYDCVSSYGGY